jgi:NAD(P)-dependent dehydrogenase (short-subunit alcohol dehydrogenase family)
VNPYIVSKFAVRGLTQALRQEVAHLDGIEVCGVLPAAVDTPIFRQAANYTGREVTALPGTVDPARVVRAILRSLERPRHEVIVGLFGQLVAPGRALAPVPFEQVTPHAMEQLAFDDAPEPPSHGNLFEPSPELAAVDGGWRSERRWLRRGVGIAAVAAVGAVAAPLAAKARRRR